MAHKKKITRGKLLITALFMGSFLSFTYSDALGIEGKKVVKMKTVKIKGKVELAPKIIIKTAKLTDYNLLNKSFYKEITQDFIRHKKKTEDNEQNKELKKKKQITGNNNFIDYDFRLTMLSLLSHRKNNKQNRTNRFNKHEIHPSYYRFMAKKDGGKGSEYIKDFNAGVIFMKSKSKYSLKFAIKRFKDALKEKHELCEAYYNIAYINFISEKFTEAEKYLRLCH